MSSPKLELERSVQNTKFSSQLTLTQPCKYQRDDHPTGVFTRPSSLGRQPRPGKSEIISTLNTYSIKGTM